MRHHLCGLRGSEQQQKNLLFLGRRHHHEIEAYVVDVDFLFLIFKLTKSILNLLNESL